uniref:Uncharacterized protein n=1 Tax=Oryctolagus cuniculus TaxID=9986 RepID=A0A5F9DKW2_RABIT
MDVSGQETDWRSAAFRQKLVSQMRREGPRARPSPGCPPSFWVDKDCLLAFLGPNSANQRALLMSHRPGLSRSSFVCLGCRLLPALNRTEDRKGKRQQPRSGCSRVRSFVISLPGKAPSG